MTYDEAIDYLRDPIGKRDQHDEAVDMAITALKNQKIAKEMMELEKIKEQEDWLHREYHRGRITAFYDSLGIDLFQ